MVAINQDRASRLRDSFQTSSRMTARFYRMYRPGATMYEPEEIVPLLNDAGVRFVVMGTHGVGAWRSEARGTVDIDFLVATRDHKRAVKVLHEAFPELEVIETSIVTRFRDKSLGKVVIDLMKPSQPLFRVAFRNTVEVGDYRAPNLEFALASKFAAMVSDYRDWEKKYIDAGDFANIVKFNKDAIDQKKLARLADRVYPGGSKEILKLVEDILAGRKIEL